MNQVKMTSFTSHSFLEPLSIRDAILEYSTSTTFAPIFLCGDSHIIMREFPQCSVDCCMTSPPYWGKRQYTISGIGLETDYRDYIEDLLAVCDEVQRVLKPTGSFWLNLGDSYLNKNFLGIPWRVSLALMDRGWILRNDIIWNKVKGGPDNAKDKLRNIHEHVFHFVKQSSGYYYDVDAIRNSPQKARVVNGSVISATGVTGVRYKRQIELSTHLTDNEKKDAMDALNRILDEVKQQKISDFRMIIRGQQRSTHSNDESVSGRAKELAARGFYFLKYHPNGTKPSDVWDIIPEDTHKREIHFAPYPEDLCKIPIIATCPKDGIVLDPFCGTGTTMAVAKRLKRKSIGIDISSQYIEMAGDRCRTYEE